MRRCAQLVLALTVRRGTAEAMLFSLLPLANGVDWGILTTGVRRYTPPRSRAVAFAVLASFLNLGQLLAGVVRDAFVLPAQADAQARAGADAMLCCSQLHLIACDTCCLARAGRDCTARARSCPCT